jgi:hypothetical protein
MKGPQVSVGTLLWLMLVLAVAMGWWTDRRKMAARHELELGQQAAVSRIVQETLRRDMEMMRARGVKAAGEQRTSAAIH